MRRPRSRSRLATGPRARQAENQARLMGCRRATLPFASPLAAGSVAAGLRAQSRCRAVGIERGWRRIPVRRRGRELRQHEGRGSEDCGTGAQMMRRRDSPGYAAISERGGRQRAPGQTTRAIEALGGGVRATRDRGTAARVGAATLRKGGSSRSSMLSNRLSIEGSRMLPTHRMKTPPCGFIGRLSSGPWRTKKAASQCRRPTFCSAKAPTPNFPISGRRALP